VRTLGGIPLNINNNEFYKKWFKSAWTYVVGAVLLSLFQIVTLATTGEPLGLTSTFVNWGAWLYIAVGGSVDKWYYFSNDAA